MTNEWMGKTPILVNQEREIEPLEPVLSTVNTFKEEWLQDILAREPAILPSGDVDPRYAQLLFIGREIAVTCGRIDNLYLSRHGYVVIVETKLWRNPEARRQVISQVIDYAKCASLWNYSELNHFYAAGHPGQTLYSAMAEKFPGDGWNEAQFVDIVNKNLQSARMLLMVVGDGIRTEAEEMVKFLNARSSMPFDLCLCELNIYTLANGSRLVIPYLTTKTHVIERVLMRVGDRLEEQQMPAEETHSDAPRAAQAKADSLRDKEEWAQKTPLRDVTPEQILDFINQLMDLGYDYHVGTKDLGIDLYLPSVGQRLKNCLMLFGEGSGAIQPSNFFSFLEKNGFSKAPAERLLEDLRPALNQQQKRTPYIDPKGYYFISFKNMVDHQEEILAAFERFVRSL